MVDDNLTANDKMQSHGILDFSATLQRIKRIRFGCYVGFYIKLVRRCLPVDTLSFLITGTVLSWIFTRSYPVSLSLRPSNRAMSGKSIVCRKASGKCWSVVPCRSENRIAALGI
jgi:hypothetical protein